MCGVIRSTNSSVGVANGEAGAGVALAGVTRTHPLDNDALDVLVAPSDSRTSYLLSITRPTTRTIYFLLGFPLLGLILLMCYFNKSTIVSL